MNDDSQILIPDSFVALYLNPGRSKPSLPRDELAARRFHEEARAVSLADHPGLVKLFDFNKLPDGRLYLLMEYVPGESLFQRLERLRGTAQNPAASTASEPRTPLPTSSGWACSRSSSPRRR